MTATKKDMQSGLSVLIKIYLVKMKKHIFCYQILKLGLVAYLFVCMVFTLSAQNQEKDEILQKAIQAHGNGKYWLDFKTSYLEMNVHSDFSRGDTLHLKSYKNNRGFFYQEYQSKKIQKKEGFNGTEYWSIRTTNHSKIENLDKQWNNLKDYNWVFFNDFPILFIIDALEKKQVINLWEAEQINGVFCFKVSIYYEQAQILRYFYISQKDYLFVAITTVNDKFSTSNTTYYYSYQKVGNIKFSFYRKDITSVGNIESFIKNLEYNPPINENIFEKNTH